MFILFGPNLVLWQSSDGLHECYKNHSNWSHRVGASLIYFISLSAANYVSQAELRAAVKFIQQQGRVLSINSDKPISLLLFKKGPVTCDLNTGPAEL